MNVWFLSAHDQPHGQSARTYEFSRTLVDRGHSVTFFTNSYCHFTNTERLRPNEKWRIEQLEDIRVVWLRTIHYTGNGFRRGLNMLSNVLRGGVVARRLDDVPDVVIGPSVPLLTGWLAWRIARQHAAAFVFEIRDVWPDALVDDGSLSKWNPMYFIFRFIEKRLYRASDRISTTLPMVFDHVETSGGDRDRVVWLPNGIDLSTYEGFDQYAGGGKTLTAMYIGGFGAAHDVANIVEVAYLLEKSGTSRWRFVLVGGGVRKAECMELARHYELSNLVFRDPVAKTEVPKLQSGADVLLACVLDSDAYRFGLNLNKIYDYFASARPVVFSGRAPNDPIAASGAGFTVPPEDPVSMVDALREIEMMSPQARIEMGRRGRDYVTANFDMERLGERMEELLVTAMTDRNQ